MRLEDLEAYQGIKKFAVAKGAQIAITYNCDCSCKHCGVGLYRNKVRKELSTEEIKTRILDRLKDCGIDVAYFFGGEPALHKDFIPLLEYAKKIGLYSRFDTNGHKLADKNFTAKVKDAGIEFILVSVDSPRPEAHNQFRGREGSWEMATQGIKNCVELGIKVGISTVVTKENLKNGDFKKVIQLGKDLGVYKIRVLTPIMCGRWYQANIALNQEEKKEFFSLLEPNFVFWEEYSDGTVPFVCCSIVRWFFFVSVYGDVQPCCYVPISFGNVRENDLKDIAEGMWKSSFFKVDKANVNRCGCLMNDPKTREIIKKLQGKGQEFPVKYNQDLFK